VAITTRRRGNAAELFIGREPFWAMVTTPVSTMKRCEKPRRIRKELTPS
jgi:hypothetical protein